jgi:hypothetical protein
MLEIMRRDGILTLSGHTRLCCCKATFLPLLFSYCYIKEIHAIIHGYPIPA